MRSNILLITVALMTSAVYAQKPTYFVDEFQEENRQVRRDKFDQVLPELMREHGVDMWIHVMRTEVPDSFGELELGSPSGVFVFTNRGDERTERAVMGRRWGATQRQWVPTEYKDPVAGLEAYDIVAKPVRIQEPLSGPVTEYDLRFEGLREFIEARDPERIALNFRHKRSQWPTYVGESDGISHTDFLLLTEEIGEKYADRIVSSEDLVIDYSIRKVPAEIALLKKIRQRDIEHTLDMFAKVERGVTPSFDNDMTTFRRMSRGLSQRGRSAGWEDSTVQSGDIIGRPEIGFFAYVLREGETEPPEELQQLWKEYLKVDKILAETIKAGLTPREIIGEYTRRFASEGVLVRDDQLHMILPKNDYPTYMKGFDASTTQLTIDSHAQVKGARPYSDETYYAPRIGSYGPDWVIDKPLAPNHQFVIEYFFYMPSPAPDGKDQYLLWWNHEDAIATESGVEYLSKPQKELYLIR